jgi:dual specificity phosphatase 12
MALNRIPGENVYIASLFALSNKTALEKANITHVVSVLRRPQADIIEISSTPFQRLIIEVDDSKDENLLEHFSSAVKFIQSGLNSGGGVLVHCVMGKSRSAAVCIAYLLNHQPNTLTPEIALGILRETRPMCEPNEGFMEQLSLYHQMGCPDDITKHPLYQRWLFQREIEESVACGRAPSIKAVRFEDEVPSDQVDSAAQITEIRCRKCRRILATTPFMLLHDKQKQSGLSLSATPECAHIFLHPLTWMRPSLFPGSTPAASSDVSSMSTADSQSEDTPLSGRLTCPNPACGSNVGKFSWPGMQCSCGRWIVPAIGVARSKVDVIEKIDVGAIGIRLPANMR